MCGRGDIAAYPVCEALVMWGNFSSMLPTFIGLGPSRAGTTTVHKALADHPHAYLPRDKEAHFFSTGHYLRGIAYYEAKFFSGYGGQSAIGEISPSYLHSNLAAARIYEALGPEIKLLVFLRNPVDRLLSEYRFWLKVLGQTQSFENYMEEQAAAAAHMRRNSDALYDASKQFCHSLYADAIARYIDQFGRDAIFPIVFECDVQKNQSALMGSLSDFLGIPQVQVQSDLHVNRSAKPKAKYHRYPAILSATKQGGKPTEIPANTLTVINDTYAPWNISLPQPSRHALAAAEVLNEHRNFKLTSDLRLSLIDRHFEADIRDTEGLLGIDLSHWRQESLPEPEPEESRPPKKKAKFSLRRLIHRFT